MKETYTSSDYGDSFSVSWENKAKALGPRTKLTVNAFSVFGLLVTSPEMTYDALRARTLEYTSFGHEKALTIDDPPRTPIIVPLEFLQGFVAENLITNQIEALQEADRVTYYRDHIYKQYRDAR